MAKQIQLRRGTTLEHTTFVGAVGEVTVDTTKDVVVVHDGITSGGVPGARQIDITAANSAIATLTANVGLLRVDVNALDPAGAAAGQAQLRANIAAANVNISNLQSNSVVQAVQIASLTTDLGGANSAITGIQIALGITNSTVSDLQQTDIAVNAAVLSIETFAYSNAAIQSSAIDQLRANVTAANAAISVNTNRVAAANVEISNLRANITAANVQITNLFANAADQSVLIATINSNIAAANTAILTNTNRVAAANVEIGNLRANITAANSAILTNTNRVAAANVEIDNLRSNITAANGAIVTANTFNQTYTDSQISVVRGGVDVSLNTLFKLANAIANDAAYSSTITSSLNGIRANVTAANAAILINTNRVAAANAAILLLQEGIDAANTRVAGANVLNAITNSNVTAANAQITNIRNVVASNGNVYTGNAIVNNLYIGTPFFPNGAPFIANTTNWLYVLESPDDNITYNIPYIGSDLNSTATSDSFKQLYSDTNTLTFNPSTNVLAAPNIATTSNTQATSTTTGALRIIGGASINVGNLYIGGSAGRSITATGNVVISGDPTTAANTGALTVSGGAAVSGNLNIGTAIGFTGPSAQAFRIGVNSQGQLEFVPNQVASLTTGIPVLIIDDAGGGIWANVPFVSNSNLSITSSTSSTSSSSGALQVTGGVGVGGSVHTGGNVVVEASTASNSAATGALIVAGGAGIGGRLNVTGNVVFGSGTSSANITTGAMVVSGGIGVSGNIFVAGNIISQSSFTTQIAAGATGTRPADPSVGMIRYNTSLQSYEGYGAGNAWSSLGGVKSVSGNAFISAELTAASGDDVLRFYSGSLGSSQQVAYMSASNVGIIINTAATSTTTGALQIAGGVGIAGNLYAAGNVILATGASSNVVVASTTSSLTPTTGALVVAGGFGLAGRLNIGGDIISTSVNDSTSTTSGSFVSAGGMGIAGNLYTGGNIIIQSTTPGFGGLTGALIVAGGVGIGGNLAVAGNLSVGGSSLSRIVSGMFMVNGADSTSGHYVKLATIPVMQAADVAEIVITCLVTGRRVPAVEAYRVFVRAVGSSATAAQPQLYVESLLNNNEKATFASGDFILSYNNSTYAAYDLFYQFNDANQRLFAKVETTTSEDTGFTGNYWQILTNQATNNSYVSLGTDLLGVQMGKSVSNLTVTYSASVTSANASTSAATGALVVTGGTGIGGVLNVGGNIVAVATTITTNTTTGAIVSRGGMGVAGAIIAGGNIVAASSAPSTNTTTGALVVTGGVGVAGNLFTGGNIYSASRIGFTYAANSTVAVYQVYNPTTDSLDTIFT